MKLTEIEARAAKAMEDTQALDYALQEVPELAVAGDIPALCATVRALAEDNARLRGVLLFLVPHDCAALATLPTLPVEIDHE